MRIRSVAAAGRAACLVALPLLAATATPLRAQQRTARDTAARDSLERATDLERVLVRAVRAEDAAPIAQTTIGRATIAERSFAQDVPLLLQGAAPSLTAHAESGTPWGYSYLRLRGLDQTRISVSLDGIPLNDPEDHQLFFANFPDLLAGVQSVQVQRGVGTTGTGTAAYAGSVNFETKPIAALPRFGAAELQAGAFNSRRVMVEGATGYLPGGFAAYVRATQQQTDGFRRNAGVNQRSAMLSAGWFGERTSVKLLGLAGRLRDTLSYLAVPVDVLRADRRANPLGPEEQDRFQQYLAAATLSHETTAGDRHSATVYRIAAGADYDVAVAPDLFTYALDFRWTGVVSAFTRERAGWRLHAGFNANTYERDHHAYVRPDLSTSLYFNTGHKDDVSGFAKLAVTRGDVTWFGDLQARHARFRYEPSVAAGIEERDIAWTFLNPKAGVTWRTRPGTELFASIGRTTREPARIDLLGGYDDLDATNAAEVGDFDAVRPETVTDLEAGVRWRGDRTQLTVNGYLMQFRNEIAPIGALTAFGIPLRQNVPRSRRLGVEADGTWRAGETLTLGGNLAVSRNRIAEYEDRTVSPAVLYTDVPPLLTPAVLTAQRVEWRPRAGITLGVEGRYQGRAFLRNDGDASLTLPDFYQLDARLAVDVPGGELSVRGVNLGDSQRFGSGYAVDGVPNFFVLTPRSVFVTLRLAR